MSEFERIRAKVNEIADPVERNRFKEMLSIYEKVHETDRALQEWFEEQLK